MTRKDCLREIDRSAAGIVPDDDALARWARDYARSARRRLTDDLLLLQRYVDAGARIIEFGSCPPFLTLALKRRGYTVAGLDIAPERFGGAVAEHGLDIRKVDFETQPVPFADNTFDVVLFNEVFEHLRINPIATISEVRRVLKPDGKLFLSTPNLRSLRGIGALLARHAGCQSGAGVYEEYRKLQLYGHMGHVREYTAREVSAFLSKLGFRTRQTLFRYTDSVIGGSFPATLCKLCERAVCVLLPGFKPLFSLVCEKVDRA